MRTCRCGTEPEPADLFCGQCGERLGAPALAAPDHTHTSLSAAEVNRRLGRIYLERGKREEAIRAWRKALALDPRDGALAAELAELESARGGAVPREVMQ